MNDLMSEWAQRRWRQYITKLYAPAPILTLLCRILLWCAVPHVIGTVLLFVAVEFNLQSEPMRYLILACWFPLLIAALVFGITAWCVRDKRDCRFIQYAERRKAARERAASLQT